MVRVEMECNALVDAHSHLNGHIGIPLLGLLVPNLRTKILLQMKCVLIL
jgi:hypothetical protein